MRITQARISLTNSVSEEDSRIAMEKRYWRTGAACAPRHSPACLARRFVRSLSGKGRPNYADWDFQTGESAALRDGLRSPRNCKGAPRFRELAVRRVQKYPLSLFALSTQHSLSIFADGLIAVMAKPSKESIISTYNDLVESKGGTLIGRGVFIKETGISRHYFSGGYWRSWSAFQAEAGHSPNLPTQKIADETVLRRFAELALEYDRIPTEPDLVLKRKNDPSFPNHSCFRRWGDRNSLLGKVIEFCEGRDQFVPVLKLLQRGGSRSLDQRFDSFRVNGFVYLLRSGKHYKLGRTNATGRRLRELAIQLPKKPDTVHVIETDDPEGIEQYWHRRFSDKREGGEWFKLTSEDVQAFKKRRFQ
jgi:Meiotically up-regulated gene 113